MKYTLTLLFLFLSAYSYAIKGWLPYLNNITRLEYGGSTQNWAITHDNNGWIYVANNSGLLQYDGNSWHLFNNGMIIREAYHDNKERIYVGAFNNFGYFSPNDKGTMQYHSLSDGLEKEYQNFSDIWDIYCIDNSIYFVSYNHIFKYVNNILTVIKSQERMLCSANINGSLYVFKENAGIFLQTGKLFIPVSSTEKISNYHISAILPYQEQKLLLITEYNGIYICDNSTTVPLKTQNDKLLKSSQLYCADIKNNKIYIGTIKSGLIVLDISTGEIQQYDSSSGLQNNSVLSLNVTERGGIWLGLDNGISYLETNMPLSHLYIKNHNYGVGYTSVIHDGFVYFGTNQGLYYTSWPIKDIRNLKLYSVKNADGQVWNLTNIGNTLFCGHNNGIYIIKKGTAVPLIRENGFWNFTATEDNEFKVLAGSYNGLVLLENTGTLLAPHWKFVHKIKGFNHSVRYIEYDQYDKIYWIFNGIDLCAVRLDPEYAQVISCQHFENLNRNKSYLPNLFKDKGRVYFTTDSGIYFYNSSNQVFEPAEEWNLRIGNKNYLRVVKNENEGSVWYIQSGKLKINHITPHGYLTDSVSTARLQNNLMDTFENINKVDSKTYIISNLDGFSLYCNPADSLLSLSNSYRCLIRRVVISSSNDHIDLYNYNGLQTDSCHKTIIKKYRPDTSFRFEMNLNTNSCDEISYSVRLKGLDEQMLPLNASGIKEYTGLKEGYYTFYIYAYNQYTHQAEVDEINLKILPPWYRSIYAYIFYLLFIIILGYGIYGLMNRRFNKQHQKCLDELREESFKREFQLKKEALAQEKKIVKLENDKLKQELLLKSQELSNSMFYIIQKQEILAFMKDELQKISAYLRKEQYEEAMRKLNRLLEKIHANIENEDNWQKLEDNFNIVHNNFISRLKECYVNLTPNELKLAAYIRMDLITKEVAPLFNLSERGVESARYKLRKKLGLSREESLSKFLQNF